MPKLAPSRTRPTEQDSTADGQPTRPSGDEAPTPVNPFTRASRHHEEPTHDETDTLGATAVQAGPYEIPSYGFLRSEYVHVETDGTGTGAAAVYDADAPFSAISEFALTDADGAPLVGPVSGYELYLINKYGGYVPPPLCDPKTWEQYTAPSTDGEFSFALRLPVEVSSRDAFCALPNMNTSQQFRKGLRVGPKDGVYTTDPTTVPSVRHRGIMEAYSPVPPTDLRGFRNQQEPPGRGSASYWSRHVVQISSGENTVQLPRLGNWLRNVIFVFRDTSGDRAAQFPSTVRMEWDGSLIFDRTADYWRQLMRERFALDAAAESANGLDTGVLAWDFTSDFDGHAGGEMRDRYLATTKGSRLELRGSFGAAGTLTILTNDVVPRSVAAVYGD